MNLDKHHHVSQSILASANWYCIFHISCAMYCTFHCVLSHCNFRVLHQYLRCLCHWSHSKGNAVNQITWLCFYQSSTIDQSVKRTSLKAEKEEQYTLSNMIYIKLPNCCFFSLMSILSLLKCTQIKQHL